MKIRTLLDNKFFPFVVGLIIGSLSFIIFYFTKTKDERKDLKQQKLCLEGILPSVLLGCVTCGIIFYMKFHNREELLQSGFWDPL